MPAPVRIEAEIDTDLDAALTALAAATGVAKATLAGEAVGSCVADDQRFLDAVEDRGAVL